MLPLEAHRVLEIFHYVIKPDRKGEALVCMAPPALLVGLAPSDIDVLTETAGEMVKRRGDYLAHTPNGYVTCEVEMNGQRIPLYVTWYMVDASRLGERLH